MTEQSKLVTNAQESTIFKSNATAIKISVSTTFHGCIVPKLRTQAWNKSKISLHIPLKQLFPSAKITLQMMHSDWSNIVTHTAWNDTLWMS